MNIRNISLAISAAATVAFGGFLIGAYTAPNRPDVVAEALAVTPEPSISVTSSASPTSFTRSTTPTPDRPELKRSVEMYEPETRSTSEIRQSKTQPTVQKIRTVKEQTKVNDADEKPVAKKAVEDKPKSLPETSPEPEPKPEPLRPKCASSNGEWDQIYDERQGQWVCPPDPYVSKESE